MQSRGSTATRPFGNIASRYSGLPMQDLYDLRRANLRDLIERRFGGSQTRFAARVHLQYPSFVSRLLSDHPTSRKNIGERMARSFETALELPTGWFDRTNPAPADDDGDSGVRFARKRTSGSLDLVPEIAAVPQIPVYGARALALLDHIDEASEVLQASETLPTGSSTQGARFAFRLDDDSMAERLPAGTLVI